MIASHLQGRSSGWPWWERQAHTVHDSHIVRSYVRLLDSPELSPYGFGEVMEECIDQKRGYPAVPDTMDELLWLSYLLFPNSSSMAASKDEHQLHADKQFYLGVHDVEDSNLPLKVHGRQVWPGDFVPLPLTEKVSDWSADDRCTFLSLGSSSPILGKDASDRSWQPFSSSNVRWANGPCVAGTAFEQSVLPQGVASGVCEHALRPRASSVACPQPADLPDYIKSFEWNSQW